MFLEKNGDVLFLTRWCNMNFFLLIVYMCVQYIYLYIYLFILYLFCVWVIWVCVDYFFFLWKILFSLPFYWQTWTHMTWKHSFQWQWMFMQSKIKYLLSFKTKNIYVFLLEISIIFFINVDSFWAIRSCKFKRL